MSAADAGRWTPGPWHISEDDDTSDQEILGPNYETIADVGRGDVPTDAANARLIELAPEMAELLERVADKLDAVHEASSGIFAMAANHGFVYGGPNYAEENAAIRDLLARARGES